MPAESNRPVQSRKRGWLPLLSGNGGGAPGGPPRWNFCDPFLLLTGWGRSMVESSPRACWCWVQRCDWQRDAVGCVVPNFVGLVDLRGSRPSSWDISPASTNWLRSVSCSPLVLSLVHRRTLLLFCCKCCSPRRLLEQNPRATCQACLRGRCSSPPPGRGQSSECSIGGYLPLIGSPRGSHCLERRVGVAGRVKCHRCLDTHQVTARPPSSPAHASLVVYSSATLYLPPHAAN